ncbi:CRP-like cAMP-binding protein [Chitinophaga skermanii]|uniref:CRP-like cAMP-binding protein n=1 Tax=Chitinophaga skermanii TaxID=331697 RepID=A0A327QML0_9BACT|nr:Crp/Fnr family transcriptional regulator [Chitinophaga skermanii]RAJ05491.1 CRP-like cAMP-binding protein [Chitinophaga skermanii]
MIIDNIINKIYTLPAASLELLKAQLHLVHYPKGTLLLKANIIEESMYFLSKGIARAFATVGDDEVTFYFGQEGDFIFSINTYIAGQKSYESFELLEPCELYEINVAHLKELYEIDVHLANWGRKFAEQELLRTEQRLIAMQCKTAQERYHDLLENEPELLQRVQLGHIASYLGISQVSLSRIRADRR